MILETRKRCRRRFSAFGGLALAFLAFSSGATAMEFLVEYGTSFEAHPDHAELKVIFEEVLRDYNVGILDNKKTLISINSCDALPPIGPKPCDHCLGHNAAHHEDRAYTAVREKLATQTCASLSDANAGCKSPGAHATANDILAFRNNWPATTHNPAKPSVSRVWLKSMNLRILGLMNDINEVNSGGHAYWVMCTAANSSWCTAGEGTFQKHAKFDAAVTDTDLYFNFQCLNYGANRDADKGSLKVALKHELNEALALSSNCMDESDYKNDWCFDEPAMQDQFRFKDGKRSYKHTDKEHVYFSVDGGKSPLVYFATNPGIVRICSGPKKHYPTTPSGPCQTYHCQGGDYGDWFSCPPNDDPRNQDAWITNDRQGPLGGMAWTALDVQGFTLAHPEEQEGFKPMSELIRSNRSHSSASSAITCNATNQSWCTAGTGQTIGKAAAHFKIRAQRSNVRCRLGNAAKAVRGHDPENAANCNERLETRVGRISEAQGSYPEFGDLGPHVLENTHWVDWVVATIDAEPGAANSRCAVRLLRAISAHLRCEGNAQLRELRGRDGTRVRQRCDQRLESQVNRLEARYEGAESCTADFETADMILTSREGFTGEIAFEIVEP